MKRDLLGLRRLLESLVPLQVYFRCWSYEEAEGSSREARAARSKPHDLELVDTVVDFYQYHEQTDSIRLLVCNGFESSRIVSK